MFICVIDIFPFPSYSRLFIRYALWFGFNKIITLLNSRLPNAGYEMIATNSAIRALLVRSLYICVPSYNNY